MVVKPLASNGNEEAAARIGAWIHTAKPKRWAGLGIADGGDEEHVLGARAKCG